MSRRSPRLPNSLWRCGLLLSLTWAAAASPAAADSVSASRSSTANTAPAVRPSWARQAWSIEEGLPQNSVHAVLQTRDGLLWIATEGGLARFDGYSFQVLTHGNTPALPGDDLCCLAEDRAGGLWIGGSAGLVRYARGQFQAPTLGPPVANAPIRAMAAAGDGSLLLLTTGGLSRVAGTVVTTLIPVPPGGAAALGQVADGSVWFAAGGSLSRYIGGGVRASGTTIPAAVTGMADGPGGALWLRTAREVLQLLPSGQPGRTWRIGADLPGTRVESLHGDRLGRVWVGTNAGLVRLSPTDAADAPKAEPQLPGDNVLAVTVDSEGDVWAGTASSGLHVLRPQRFGTLPEMLDDAVTSLAETTNGDVWMGTREDGLRRFVRAPRGLPRGLVVRPAGSSGLASQIILSLAAGGHNDVWVGTPDGLSHLEANGRVTTVTSSNGLPDDFVRSLLAEPDGSLWVGTRRGLALWRGGKPVRTWTRENGLPGDLIGAMLRLPGTAGPDPGPDARSDAGLWVATLGGLAELAADGGVRAFTARDGLAGDVVTSLASDGAGRLWIGSRDGGLTLRAGGRFTRFTGHGLPASVESVLPDGRGDLWLTTRHGVDRVAIEALLRCAASGAAPRQSQTPPLPRCDLPLTHFGYADGLRTEDLSALGHPAALRARDGELWFATRRGVAIADPAEPLPPDALPPVIVEAVEVDDRPQPLGAAPLTIPPGHDRLAVSYAGIHLRAPSRVSYRYRLAGFDPGWIAAGSRRTAFYTNLPPGRYTFTVEASVREGVWTSASAALELRILPPFYRRWWFYLLCVLAAGGLAWAIYYLRLRQIRSRFDAVLAERNRIAREIHDTLAQDFVAVSLQLELAAQRLGRSDVPGASAQLDTTRKLVREGLAEARESIWQLRATAAADSLPTRLARVVDRAADRANGRGAGLTARFRVHGSYRALAPALEGELLRIAGEAINNALRHAGATRLDVELSYSPRDLLLTVTDNGQGFAGAAPEGHFGLRGMRERAAAIGGELLLRSAPGEGTVVSLRTAL